MNIELTNEQIDIIKQCLFEKTMQLYKEVTWIIEDGKKARHDNSYLYRIGDIFEKLEGKSK